MRNKNMMIMGIVMVICQVMVLGIFGLIFTLDYGMTVMIPKDAATKIIVGTFFTLINLVSLGFIVYGASDKNA